MWTVSHHDSQARPMRPSACTGLNSPGSEHKGVCLGENMKSLRFSSSSIWASHPSQSFSQGLCKQESRTVQIEVQGLTQGIFCRGWSSDCPGIKDREFSDSVKLPSGFGSRVQGCVLDLMVGEPGVNFERGLIQCSKLAELRQYGDYGLRKFTEGFRSQHPTRANLDKVSGSKGSSTHGESARLNPNLGIIQGNA